VLIYPDQPELEILILQEDDINIWVKNGITTEPCSTEAWNHGLFWGNHTQMTLIQVSEL
jgi:hypothetical protein